MSASCNTLGWTSVAHRHSFDTAVVVSDHIVGLVGRVGEPPARDEVAHASDLLAHLVRGVDQADTPGMVDAVIEIVGSVHDESQRGVRARGAATLTAVILESSGSAAVIHVGDASAFRLRVGAFAELTPLTQQHTLAADLLAAGRSPNARAHSVVNRVVGGDEPPSVDITRVRFEPGRTAFVLAGRAPIDGGRLVRGIAATTNPNEVLAGIGRMVDTDTAVIVAETEAG